MSLYASKQDLLDRDASFIWTVATSADDSDLLDEVAIEACLQDATDEINSFLTRYQLPLETTPSVIKRLCISMAFYWLADRDASVTDLVQKRYDQALQALREIQSNKRDLGLPSAEKPTETATGKVEVTDAYRSPIRQSLHNIL